MSEVKNFGFEIRPSRASSIFEFPTSWTVVYANLRVSVSYSRKELELQNIFWDLEKSCYSRNPSFDYKMKNQLRDVHTKEDIFDRRMRKPQAERSMNPPDVHPSRFCLPVFLELAKVDDFMLSSTLSKITNMAF